MRKVLVQSFVMLALCPILAAQANTSKVGFGVAVYPPYLYKVSFIQAAPGKLLELIDLQKARNVRNDSGDEYSFWMRHSQGDRWDLMIVYPMGSYAEYYKPERIAKRAAAESKNGQKFRDDIARRRRAATAEDARQRRSHVRDETPDPALLNVERRG